MNQRFSNRNGSQAMEWVQTLKHLRLLGLRRRPARTDMGMSKRDYVHAETPKPPPEVPVRVYLKSQLMAALRQRVRPIVIEYQDLARPFARLLRARELRLRAVGGLVAETMCYALIGTTAPTSMPIGTSANTCFQGTYRRLSSNRRRCLFRNRQAAQA